MTVLARFNMGQKLWGFAAILVLLIALVGGVAVINLAKLVTEIVAIAEEDLPLAERAETIMAHQLEQMIHFERALRLGEVAHFTGEDAIKAEYKAEIKHFDELSHTVTEEIREAVILIEEILAKPHDAEATAEWQMLHAGFGHAETAHAAFETHAHEVFEALTAGEMEGLHERIAKVEHEGDALDHELEELSHELIRYTKQAALKAEHDEIAAQRQIAIVLGLSLVFATVIAWMLTRGITRPMRQVVTALGALGKGDTSIQVTPLGRDEMAELAVAYGALREQTEEAQRLRRERREMEEKTREERQQLMQSLANRFEADVAGVVTSVVGSSEQLTATAGSMNRVSEQTAQRASSVAAATEQASNNMQTVAAAGEEMGKSIEEIVQLVGRSTEMAGGAVKEVDSANEQVRGLSDAADKIGQVITLISDIAEQTNLLALNATIEAARAGEAGKGFAVVASEVKNLANQTAKAADEVTSHIERVQNETSDAVKAIDRIGQTIQQIEEVATSVSAAVEEQSAATNEIVRNVHEASTGTREVAGNVEGVTEAARETETAAGEMRAAAGDLSERSRQLRGQVDKFLQEVRSA